MIDPRWSVRLRWPVITGVISLAHAVPAVAGGAHAALAGVGLAAVLTGRLVRRRRELMPRDIAGWRLANACFLVTAMIAAAVRAPLLLVALSLVLWLQVHRAWTGRTSDDDRVAVLLGLLLVLLGSILTESAWLGPLLLFFVTLVPLALVLCQLGRTAQGRSRVVVATAGHTRPGGLRTLLAVGPLGLLLTSALFVAIPRVEGGRMAQLEAAQNLAGFGEEVSLGDLGEIKDNPEIVLRAQIWREDARPVAGPFYFRGAALDQFDGRRWTRAAWQTARSSSLPSTDPKEDRVFQEILLEPIEESVLFGIAEIRAIEDFSAPTRVDGNGTWTGEHEGRRISYTAVSVPRDPAYYGPLAHGVSHTASEDPQERTALRRGQWSGLPADLDPRIHELAEGLAAELGPNASPYERVSHVERYLAGTYEYTLVPEQVDARQPLSSFLFQSRRGHCEYFATALAVLLRAQGIPARVVNGFYGGEWNPLGDYWIVRQRDAHSWVEAWLGSAGWVALDATPAAATAPRSPGGWTQVTDWLTNRWHRSFLRYDFRTQLSIGSSVAQVLQGRGHRDSGLPDWSPLVLVMGMAVGAAAGARRLLWWLAGPALRARRIRVKGVARTHRRARRLVQRRGWKIPEHLPHVEAAEWLVARAGPDARGLLTLAWLVYRVRYRGEDEGAVREEALAASRALRGLPRHRSA